MRKKQGNTFRIPSVGWFLLILPAIGLNFYVAYSPYVTSLIPSWFHKCAVLSTILCVAAHLGESIYAYYIASGNKWKWAIQTFMIGFPSLRLLLEEERRIKKLKE